MKPISAIIVDEQLNSRTVLKNLLKKNDPKIKILAECDSLTDAIKKIDKLKPSVVFIDVQLPNYVSTEIANLIGKVNFEIIFISENNEFATKAFDLCAIDYIVKPINESRFTKAVIKLFSKIESNKKLQEYQKLLENIKERSSEKLIIPELGNRRVINTNDIIAIEADGAYTSIHLKNDKKISTSKNLKHYEKSIANKTNFFRSHRSWIINLDCLKRINRTENKLYLEQNLVARISRSCYHSFDNLFKYS